MKDPIKLSENERRFLLSIPFVVAAALIIIAYSVAEDAVHVPSRSLAISVMTDQ